MMLVFLLKKTESRACVMEIEQNKNTQPGHKENNKDYINKRSSRVLYLGHNQQHVKMQQCVAKMPLYPLNWSQVAIYIYWDFDLQTHRQTTL